MRRILPRPRCVQALHRLLARSSAACCATSISFWQQNTGRRAVGLCNDPNLGPCNTGCVRRHQPKSLLKRKLILRSVMSVNVPPITGLMAGKVDRKVVARYPNCCEGTGRRDNLTKGEEGLHAVPFGFSTVGLATGVS